ncbi:hypothetical protein EI94DRAFT_267652 [Lactarius quietus]|nr:hypothetical protein EI94DRAFT_267652 [Lactarius quietus]
MTFFTGSGMSSPIYYCLNAALPPPGRFKRFKEVDFSDGESPRNSGHEVWAGADHNKNHDVRIRDSVDPEQGEQARGQELMYKGWFYWQGDMRGTLIAQMTTQNASVTLY